MIKQPLFFKNLLKFHFHFRFQAAPKEGKKNNKMRAFQELLSHSIDLEEEINSRHLRWQGQQLVINCVCDY